MNTDIDDPISSGSSKAPAVDEGSVQTLVSFGFHEDLARKALKASVRYCGLSFPFSISHHSNGVCYTYCCSEKTGR